MKSNTKIFQTLPRIVFGIGAVDRVGEEAKRLGAGKAVIITDPGIVAAGIDSPVTAALKAVGLETALFQGVEPDPRIEIVAESATFVKDHKADIIVGLGGGSSLDIAKATAVMMTNPGPIESYAGVNLVPKPGLSTIMIPTTSGTGSEVTSISVLSDTENKVKKGVVSDYMFAKLALVDPALTVKLPPHITASTGLDALIHAIESYVGKDATVLTEPLALSAIQLIAKYLRRAYANGSDLAAREGMSNASLIAGLAFANTQTGAAHACGMSLGGMFHVPHGVATSLMLPAVMKFNSIVAPEKFADIAMAFGEVTEGLSPMAAAEKAVDAVVRLIDDLGFQMGLENYGVQSSDIPALAAGAMPATRLWNNNPRNATQKEVEEIFRSSFSEEV
ncbi:MAG: iron-containing alcohol dehydrogenase [Deltaproteobacteria bacterium]|nr:iron-containing alcohol dehydrogenase [Deltaproteobacteria bacterium]